MSLFRLRLCLAHLLHFSGNFVVTGRQMTPVTSSLLLPKTSLEPLKAKWLRHNYNLSLNLASDTRKKQWVTQYVLCRSFYVPT